MLKMRKGLRGKSIDSIERVSNHFCQEMILKTKSQMLKIKRLKADSPNNKRSGFQAGF
jgi:hypothetical protein